MYQYEIGDLVVLKSEISYFAKKYEYHQNNEKLFLGFEELCDNELFIVIKRLDEFSANAVSIFSIRTGFILEAYPHIFVKTS